MPKALSDFCKEESSKVWGGFVWAINYEFKSIPREDARDLNFYTLQAHLFVFFLWTFYRDLDVVSYKIELKIRNSHGFLYGRHLDTALHKNEIYCQNFLHQESTFYRFQEY